MIWGKITGRSSLWTPLLSSWEPVMLSLSSPTSSLSTSSSSSSASSSTTTTTATSLLSLTSWFSEAENGGDDGLSRNSYAPSFSPSSSSSSSLLSNIIMSVYFLVWVFTMIASLLYTGESDETESNYPHQEAYLIRLLPPILMPLQPTQSTL